MGMPINEAELKQRVADMSKESKGNFEKHLKWINPEKYEEYESKGYFESADQEDNG